MQVWRLSVKKENGVLIFNDIAGYETRNPSTIWLIKEADAVYKWPDFPEMLIYTCDYENGLDEYTYSKQNSYNKLVPDFNFHMWPQVGINDYNQLIDEVSAAGSQPFEINKVGWLGNINTNIRRRLLFQLGDEHQEVLNILDCGNWSPNPNSVKLNNNQYMSIPELVKKYSVLIDVEGNGYSGRVKFLLWTRRPLILVDRPHKEYFYEFLKPWVHYIPVDRDMTDLVEKATWCLEHYEEALIIANNAYEFSKKYLTREACYKQWNHIITGADPGF